MHVSNRESPFLEVEIQRVARVQEVKLSAYDCLTFFPAFFRVFRASSMALNALLCRVEDFCQFKIIHIRSKK